MEITPSKSFYSEDNFTINESLASTVHPVGENEIEKNLKFTLFYTILFVIIFITNLIYYNAPNHKLENFIEDVDQFNYNISSLYSAVSRFTDKNKIYIKLKLDENENIFKINNEEFSKLSTQLFVEIKFSVNRMNIKIFENENEFQIPQSLYHNHDLNLDKISTIEESNFKVVITSSPFNIIVMRKTTLQSDSNDTLFDSRTDNFLNTLIYSKRRSQFYTKLIKGHQTYGLGENFGSIKLENRRYFLFSNKSDELSELYQKENKNGFSSFPLILSVNPKTLNAHGFLIFNSGPIEGLVKDDGILFTLNSGIIDLYIFTGPSPKEVIIQLQKTLGMPLLPTFDALRWENNFTKIEKVYNFEEKIAGGGQIVLNHNLITKNLTNFAKNEVNKIVKKNSGLDLNSMSPAIHLDLNLNLDSKFKISGKFSKYIKNLADSIRDTNDETDQEISSYESYYNILPLYEIKSFYDYMVSFSQRPMIFSRSNFIGTGQYSGKFIGKIHASFDGMKMALLQTMKYNVYGNPHIVHIACDGADEELCIRWIQMVFLFPHIRLENSLLNTGSNNFFDKIRDSLKLRYSLSLYIYSYFLKMSLEGGSLIRPLFLDFVSKSFSAQVFELETQFMVGSSIMINPVFEYHTTSKSTFFPSDKFYDFYTGEWVNQQGGGFYEIPVSMDKPSIFLRGGLITPFQSIPSESYQELLSMDLKTIRSQPIELLIALDSNYRSTGRILLDDLKSTDSITKKMYYKMEISSSFTSNNFVIFFHVNSYKYKLPPDEYIKISKITILGFTRLSVKKITLVNRHSREEIKRENYNYDQSIDVLSINNLEIGMDIDSKIVIL